MYMRIKAPLVKIPPSDGSTQTEVPKAVSQKTHSLAEGDSSPNMRMILQQFPIYGTNQQNNENICKIVECIVNAQDVLTRKINEIEQKNSAHL